MISVVIFPGVSAQTELGSWEIRKFQENLKTSQNFKEVWSRSNIHRIYTIYTTFFHFTHIVMFWLCILFSAPSGTLSEVSLNEWSNVQINSLETQTYSTSVCTYGLLWLSWCWRSSFCYYFPFRSDWSNWSKNCYSKVQKLHVQIMSWYHAEVLIIVIGFITWKYMQSLKTNHE